MGVAVAVDFIAVLSKYSHTIAAKSSKIPTRPRVMPPGARAILSCETADLEKGGKTPKIVIKLIQGSFINYIQILFKSRPCLRWNHSLFPSLSLAPATIWERVSGDFLP